MLPLMNTTMPLYGAFRTVIEEAALMWLEPLSIRQGGYLRALDHYNGEMDTPEGREALFALVKGSLPAVLVATGDENFEPMGRRGTQWKASPEVEVLVFSGARRSRETQNLGDEQGLNDDSVDPGCFWMMQDIFRLLTKRQTGDCRTTRFRPMFTRVVIQAPEFTMWRMRFAIDYTISVLDDAELDGAGPIESIDHLHNLADEDSPPPNSINPVAEGRTE